MLTSVDSGSKGTALARSSGVMRGTVAAMTGSGAGLGFGARCAAGLGPGLRRRAITHQTKKAAIRSPTPAATSGSSELDPLELVDEVVVNDAVHAPALSAT